MISVIVTSRIARFEHGIGRESRLSTIDPVVGEKTDGHQCRRSVGADRCRDHKCLMMKITHPCAVVAQVNRSIGGFARGKDFKIDEVKKRCVTSADEPG